MNNLENSLVYIQASRTFPRGFSVQQIGYNLFDSLSTGQATYNSVGGNGDLINWTKPQPLEIELYVQVNSSDEKNLSIIYEQNTARLGKPSISDIVTMEGTSSEGRSISLHGGIILGNPQKGLYKFVFEKLS